MYPKLFIENFWRGEEKEEIFVCIPINNGEFDKKFKDVIKPAVENIKPKREVIRSDHKRDNEITQEIFDSIAHAKILLFDLSDDPKYGNKVNGNVLYELGIANTVRDKTDILLIREEKSLNPEYLPFDVRELPIEVYSKEELETGWMQDKINRALERKDWQKNKLLEIAKKSMEPVGFGLMDKYYQKKQIFDGNLSDRERIAALRLIDFGVLRGLPAVRGEHCERLEYSYCWTQFGQAFKKYLELDKRPRN